MTSKILLAAIATFFSLTALSYADAIVASASKWNWLHPTDGTDPAGAAAEFHTTFFKLDFDDSSWKNGDDAAGPHGGFGYGEEGFKGVDIGTPAAEGKNGGTDRKTAYFRHYFKTEKGFKDLVLKCQRDDGLIIYIDGKEVGRDNIGADAKESYDLFSTATVSGEDETKVFEIKLTGEIGAGDHVLAISLHNRGEGSSDMRIAEISLEGTPVDAAK
jgi:hypothetical protein